MFFLYNNNKSKRDKPEADQPSSSAAALADTDNEEEEEEELARDTPSPKPKPIKLAPTALRNDWSEQSTSPPTRKRKRERGTKEAGTELIHYIF